MLSIMHTVISWPSNATVYLQKSKYLVWFANGGPSSETCNVSKNNGHGRKDICKRLGTFVLGSISVRHDAFEIAGVTASLVAFAFMVVFLVSTEKSVMIHFGEKGGDNGIGLGKLVN